MGASHAIGHVLGGTFEVPHYLVTPVLMPSVLRYNKRETEPAQRRLAAALAAPGMDAADALEALLTKLGLPTRLENVGLKKSDYPKIGEIAVKSIFARTNPRPLREAEDVVQLLLGRVAA